MNPASLRVGDVARVVGCTPSVLHSLASKAALLYDSRPLTKGSKTRNLRVPRVGLKRAQRSIYRGLLRCLAVSPAAHSAPGRSAITNAKAHVAHPYVSILDIEDCFPSVGPHRVRAALLRQGFFPDVATLITRLCTADQELPQGAPTSPPILNLVLIDLDGKLSAIARGAGLTYTRYVDDICVSGGTRTPRIAMVFEQVFRRHHFAVKLSKRCDWGPRDRHTVTGIVVNVRPNASPEYVATLRTTLLKHRSGESPLTSANLATVRGQLRYVKSLNPSVARRLERILESTV